MIEKDKTPSTVKLLDELPPSPEHVKVNVLLSFFLIFTASDPDNNLDPVQSPLAEQLDEFVDDQVKVTSLLMSEDMFEEDKLITGAGVVGCVGVGSPPPPPPPPPQDEINKIIAVKYRKFVNL